MKPELVMRMRLTHNSMLGCLLIVLGLMLTPEANAQPSADLPVILAVGESTTAGFGVPREMSYPSQLQALLAEHGYAYRVVNHGRNGITTSMALSGLDRGLRLGPRIVIIALGGNDRANRFAALSTKENLRKMVSLYVSIGAHVFLADRSGRADRADPDSSSPFSELAAEEGAILMPSLRAGVAGRPELLLRDGSHPNGDGYAIVARQIFGLIEPYLASPDDAIP